MRQFFRRAGSVSDRRKPAIAANFSGRSRSPARIKVDRVENNFLAFPLPWYKLTQALLPRDVFELYSAAFHLDVQEPLVREYSYVD